jgi:MFS family permease
MSEGRPESSDLKPGRADPILPHSSSGARSLPRAVVLLGLTAFFTDASGEMIFSLLPVFLADVLHASPGYLGLVEGAADSVASLLKLASGRLADRLPRRKPLVLAGYGLASTVRPLMAIATAPWHVLAVRVSDRVGKGVRGAPRDALIADVSEKNPGRAFGFHRAMDHAGAIVGPLMAVGFTAGLGLGMRTVFWIGVVPGAIATLLVLLVREPPRAGAGASASAGAGAGASASAGAGAGAPALPKRLVAYFALLLLFSLGNSSDAFLLLRGHDFGISAPLLWTAFHVSKLVSSLLGGDASDRVPRARLILVGWALYAAVYVGFAFATTAWHIWALFIVYGCYYGLTEPAEKALVKDLAPAASRGRAYGWYNFVIGVSALPAGLGTGALWNRFGAPAALGACAGLAGLAAILLVVWLARSPRAPLP